MTMASPITGRPLRAVFLERLIEAGTWVTRDALAAGASSCKPAIEDALADLVMDGHAEYREHSGYRLTGSLIQRRAVALLHMQPKNPAKKKRGVYSEVVGDELRIGVAEHNSAAAHLGVVTYELAVPLPQDPGERLETQMRAANALLADIEKENA